MKPPNLKGKEISILNLTVKVLGHIGNHLIQKIYYLFNLVYNFNLRNLPLAVDVNKTLLGNKLEISK